MPTQRPPKLCVSTFLEMVKVSKLEDIRVRFPAFEITLLPSNFVLFQCNIVVVLTSTLSHLRKMTDIARYIVHDFGVKKPTTSCKLIHLGEMLSAKRVGGEREEISIPCT